MCLDALASSVFTGEVGMGLLVLFYVCWEVVLLAGSSGGDMANSPVAMDKGDKEQ